MSAAEDITTKRETAAAGLYIHIPFCLKKCNYCDFYSLAADEQTKAAYSAALLKAAEKYRDQRIDTVYFGGGNPLLLSAQRLCRLLDGLGNIFDISPDAEITAEANPEDISPQAAAALLGGGFNRLSIGVQSLNNATLATLGRRHSAETALAAVYTAASAGFARLSADLMLALPGESVEDTLKSAERLAALPLDHVSAYMLIVEEGTRFWELRDSLRLPDEEQTAELYLNTCELLENSGFEQYEISNFAKQGGESRHNLKYWRLQPYIGLGAAAHSFFGGRRFFYPRSLEDFIRSPHSVTDDGEGGNGEEYVVMSLRLREGMELERAEKLGITLPEEKIRQWEKAGLCEIENGRLKLTKRGFLVSNGIMSELI